VNIERRIFPDTTAAELQFDPVQFFDGNVACDGFVIDRMNKVRRSFVIRFFGTRVDNELKVAETIQFSDGEITNRSWRFAPVSDGKWIAHANDIPGDIHIRSGAHPGESRWTYTMPLTVGGKQLDFSFEDVMVMTSATQLTAITHVRKFGITVAQIVSTYRKLETGR
jgi:hypothetical protein